MIALYLLLFVIVLLGAFQPKYKWDTIHYPDGTTSRVKRQSGGVWRSFCRFIVLINLVALAFVIWAYVAQGAA